MPSHDIIIIGAGQNSLVAAFYLARGGHTPLVLERRPVVGGAAAIEEFHPGFRGSVLDGVHGPLASEIWRDMHLDEAHGFHWLEPKSRLCALAPDDRALLLDHDARASAKRIESFSAKDAAKYVELHSIFTQVRSFIDRLLISAPPEIEKPAAADFWNLLQMGRGFRKLGARHMQRLIRWAPMAAADFVAEFFETELLRAAIAARGIFGAAAGPWSAGTTALLLLRCGAAGFPDRVAPRFTGAARGVSESLAAAAKQAGAEIRTNAEVARILVKDGTVSGVALSTGEEIPAKAVVSGADPKRTFLNLLEPVHLAPSFLQKMRNYRSRGVVARILLALDALPNFPALKNLPEAQARDALASRILIAPEIDYIERAFDASKYGEFSRAPYLEVSVPSLLDPSLAPACPDGGRVGKHVMSIHMQYAPYKLKGDWNSQRDALANTVIKTLAEYAPDLPSKILARRVITPLDLENDYGLTGGHIYHGELSLDQLFTMRPLLGFARYQSPIHGLFLCGAGTHPGFALAGASGLNASREIIKSLRSTRR